MQPGWNANLVDLADIDGDGDLDILIGNDDNISNRVYTNDGFGSFTDVTSTVLPTNGFSTQNQVVADFDGDGDLDWFTSDYYYNHFYENDGNGVFTDTSAAHLSGLPSLFGNNTPSLHARPTSTATATSISWFCVRVSLPDPESGRRTVLSPFQPPVGGNYPTTWFVDYDGDGDADVLAAGGRSLFQNQGNGTFVDVTNRAFLRHPPTRSPASTSTRRRPRSGDDLAHLAQQRQRHLHRVGGSNLVALRLQLRRRGGRLRWRRRHRPARQAQLPAPVNAPMAPARGSNYGVEFHARPGSVVGACARSPPANCRPAVRRAAARPPPPPLAVATIATGPRVLSWSLPNLPALAGLELHYQSLVDALEAPVLGNMIRDVVQ
jgi:hypothetical protein